MSRNRKIPWRLWSFQGVWLFFCYLTLLNPESVYKQEKWQNPLTIMIFSMDLVVFPVSRHFWKVKVSGNRETPKSLEYGKRLETGKKQNPLNTKSVWKQGNSKILWIRNMSRNRENSKILLIQKTWRTDGLTRGPDRPFRCLDLPASKLWLFAECRIMFLFLKNI